MALESYVIEEKSIISDPVCGS